MRFNLGKFDGRGAFTEIVKRLDSMDSYVCIFSKGKIYFFDDTQEYFTYDFESDSLTLHQTEAFPGTDETKEVRKYCEFQGNNYLLHSSSALHCVKVYSLNEDDLKWIPVCEHVFDKVLSGLDAVSSPNELLFVFEFDVCNESEESDDYITFIYSYESESQDLLPFAQLKSYYERYLCIPEYLF